MVLSVCGTVPPCHTVLCQCHTVLLPYPPNLTGGVLLYKDIVIIVNILLCIYLFIINIFFLAF